jgi:hypothetical protein
MESGTTTQRDTLGSATHNGMLWSPILLVTAWKVNNQVRPAAFTQS